MDAAGEERTRRPSLAHEGRVAMLDVLGALSGHVLRVPLPLPDGSRPDVALMDVGCVRLLLGDAKESEGPGDLASQARISRYLRWLGLQVRCGRQATFVVCCPSLFEAKDWTVAVASIVEAELELSADSWSARVAPDAAVGAITLSATVEGVTSLT